MWQAHKAVIGGKIIAHGPRIRKERQKEIVGLLEEIHKLEIKHKAGLNLVDSQRLETLRSSLAQCLDRKVKNKHRYFAHRFYEQGSKGGKLLARQLKKQQDSRHVPTLTVNNKQIVDTQTIAAECKHFYKSLYKEIDSTSSGAVDGGLVNRIQEYLKGLGIACHADHSSRGNGTTYLC